MTIKELLNPWAVIRELRADLAAMTNERDMLGRIAERRLDKLEDARETNAFLAAELTALKSAQQPRDPVTGRMRAKVKA